MSHPKKIPLLILTTSFPRSADDETCAYIREFARSLTDKFKVTVLAPADRQADDGSQDEFTLIRSRSFLPSSLDPLQASDDLNERVSQGIAEKFLLGVSLLAYFIRALKLSFRAEAICSHWMLPSGLIGAVVARLLNRPHITVEHSGALHLLGRIACGKLLARLMVSSSHRVVVVSRNLQEKLLALYPAAKEKIEVVPMGVQRTAFRRVALHSIHCPPEGGTLNLTLLFIGRLVEIKGLHVLLNALATLPEVRLLIAGDGEKRNAFERLAKQLNVKATFLGRVNRAEKAQCFAACDAVVIPSLDLPDGRTEGMPVVALEALAAGKPIIASQVGGLAEIIKDSRNGLLFEAGNSEMLAEKIRSLFADRELQQTISFNALQTVAAFDWQIIGARFAKIIQKSLVQKTKINSVGLEYRL